MLSHVLIVLGLWCLLALLVKWRLLTIDLSFPFFLGIGIMAIFSTVPAFVDGIGDLLNIKYAPISVIFIVISLMLGLVTVLAVKQSRALMKNKDVVRYLMAQQLREEEKRVHDWRQAHDGNG